MINDEWLKKLNRYLWSGHIRRQRHPFLPLTILNYTNRATYDELWDEVTLNCRGLVLDDEHNIVIKCPPKFFNHDQKQAPDISTWKNPKIYQKLDGYYISIKDDSKYGLIVTSRGSFDNQYVSAAKELLAPVKAKLLEGYTYFCELLQTFDGDEDKIVAKYDAPSLYCWGIRDAQGQELANYSAYSPFPPAPEVAQPDLENFLAQEVEGVVIFNPETSQRVKVKTDWYLLRHRIISNCTPKRVWDILSQGDKLEDYDIPDEFMPTLQMIEHDLVNQFEAIRKKAEDLADEVSQLSDKELALSTTIDPEYKSLIFKLRKDQVSWFYKEIWKKIKP